MPRNVPHFKTMVSIQNHQKTMGIYEDDSLLAMYLRVGLMAVERYADRTGDSFLCSGLDLERLAGCRGVANARRKLGRLEASGGPSLCQEGAGWRLTIPNFAEKQGFQNGNGAAKGSPSASASASTTTTNTETPIVPAEKPQTPEGGEGEVPQGDGKANGPSEPDPKPKRKPKATLCPDQLEPDQRYALLVWADKHSFTKSQVIHGFNAVKDWSHGNNRRRVDWVATIRNAIRRGWAVEGWVESDDDRYEREMAAQRARMSEGDPTNVH